MIDTRVRDVIDPALIAAIEEVFADEGPGPKRKVWTFVNNKGGAGKTFNVMALAYVLAVCYGLHILIVDMDPQGNATRRAGYSAVAMRQKATLTEALQLGEPGGARRIRLDVKWTLPEDQGSIQILPARLDLETIAEQAAIADAVERIETQAKLDAPDILDRLLPILKQVVGNAAQPRERLKTLLGNNLLDEYDLVLIDCPPSLGHLTQNAYAASDGVILCTKAEFDGVNGAVRTRQVLTETRFAMGVPHLDVHGVILTDLQRVGGKADEKRVHGSHTGAEECISDLKKAFGPLVWDPFLQRKSAIATNSDYGVPVLEDLDAATSKYVSTVLIQWAARLLKVSIA